MTLKIMGLMIAAVISIGGLYLSKPEKPRITQAVSLLIIIGLIVGIVVEVGQERNQKQKEHRRAKDDQAIREKMIDLETVSTLIPGNALDPHITTQDNAPPEAIKLHLGCCIAWWKTAVSQTYTVVEINNEPVLSLSIDENGGLLLSAKIRREDGKEIMNLTRNKYIRIPTAHVEYKRVSEQELIVSSESQKALLNINYLNEKTITIKGHFYDSQGNWVLTMDDEQIIDICGNRSLPGASFGECQTIFSYSTCLPPYGLTIAATQPIPIDTGYRISYMHEGREN